MASLLHCARQLLTRMRIGGIDLSNARYERLVRAANALGNEFAELSDRDLRSRMDQLRQSWSPEASVDDVVEPFGLIREAASRTLGMRPYDTQMLAAFAMYDGKLVEMQTGEGKTLAAVLPAAVRALSGRGVHILTFNDYLAGRDADWMGPIYRHLELSVGHVQQGMSASARRTGYACDVTYVTAKEAGFDFLRDQRAMGVDQLVQRGFCYAIVDEADSILIDEARVPLVIAGHEDREGPNLYQLADLVGLLRPHVDFSVDQGWRNVILRSAGLDLLEQKLACGELHCEKNVELLARLNLALQARVLLRRDVDYIVRNGAIELIDEFTGRVAENRKWPHGLQAAIEAKERLVIQPEGKILNSITLQHFVEQYEFLSGMTGTAQEAADELDQFYGLRVVVVPTNRPCIRNDHPDRVFPTRGAKFAALAEEIATEHRRGRPVLVGTASVGESEHLAMLLSSAGVDCQVLNAKNDHDEAEMIANAGQLYAVTISTNMAGRGTDIRLGGQDQRRRDQVVALGGLYVVGTTRHESRRIDNQLRGRAGRQGDPGESRFFVSLEDHLIRRYGVRDAVNAVVDLADAEYIEDPQVAQRIAHVQRIIEGESFEIRRTLRQYSFCLERQRREIEKRRRRLLTELGTTELLARHCPELFDQLVATFGLDPVRRAERQVALYHIDRRWSDHLELVSDIRSHIHLRSMGGFGALDGFNQQINVAFRDLNSQIEADVIDTMAKVRITDDGIDLKKEGLLGPSSTWTYMINDNPMGDVGQRLARGIKRMIRRLR